jgi:hypothetical protein
VRGLRVARHLRRARAILVEHGPQALHNRGCERLLERVSVNVRVGVVPGDPFERELDGAQLLAEVLRGLLEALHACLRL